MRYILFSFVMAMGVTACNNESDGNTVNKDTAATNDAATTDTMTGHPDHPPTAGTDTAGSRTVSSQDRDFVLKAGMGNTAEVEAGKLAADNAGDAEVKEFGSTMVKDHGDAQAKLNQATSSLALNVPDSVDAEHKKLAARLKSLKGSDFDKTYISAQVKDHEKTVALFQKQIAEGTNPALKAFATETLPHLKMHLEKAQKLQVKK